MPGPHFYANLDKDSKLTLELDMRQLAERVVGMNHGVHRLLSHLMDVRRERHNKRIAMLRACGTEQTAIAADSMEIDGDPLADALSKILLDGLT